MIDQISKQFNQVVAERDASAAQWVKPFEPSSGDEENQFILFIKPEATDLDAGVKLEAVLGILLDHCERFNVSLGGIRVVNGNYLAEHSVMDQHYGVINQISKGGRAAISTGAETKLVEDFGADIEAGTRVLGAHEFLAEQPDFSPLSLCVLNDNLPTHKLGGGTYALNMKVVGHPYLVLNSFHPYQLVPYTSAGRGIVIFEGRSNTSWEDLRGKLAGATNPQVAAEGSIRNALLHHQAETGMVDVSQGANGIHLSAGPLEGMVELQRFFTEHGSDHAVALSDTRFAQALAAQGVDAAGIEALAGNPDLVVDGKSVSAFDATEELDSTPSAKLLAGAASGA